MAGNGKCTAPLSVCIVNEKLKQRSSLVLKMLTEWSSRERSSIWKPHVPESKLFEMSPSGNYICNMDAVSCQNRSESKSRNVMAFVGSGHGNLARAKRSN